MAHDQTALITMLIHVFDNLFEQPAKGAQLGSMKRGQIADFCEHVRSGDEDPKLPDEISEQFEVLDRV